MRPIEKRDEAKYFSQNGEGGILTMIFNMIGSPFKTFVEIGVGDGLENNTRWLATQGWCGHWFDMKQAHYMQAAVIFKKAKVTPNNVYDLMRPVPVLLDLLSIDIDGHDYWVWKAIAHHPRVVVIEYNGYLPPPISKTIPYDPDYVWSQTTYFGASLCALHKLAVSRGYALVYCNHVKAFFVRADLAGEAALTPEQAFKPGRMNRPVDPREKEMVEV